jgi:hypothetical protein
MGGDEEFSSNCVVPVDLVRVQGNEHHIPPVAFRYVRVPRVYEPSQKNKDPFGEKSQIIHKLINS